MMIPPLVRTGPLLEIVPNKRYVVLTTRGWEIASLRAAGELLVLNDAAMTVMPNYIHPYEVFCWMPADGS